MRRLTCKELIMDYLDAYVDVTLSEQAVAECERHLGSCAACRAYFNTYARTRDLVGRAARVVRPSEMEARLRRFLRGHFSNPES